MITLPKTVSKRLDLSFGIFARRGEKYSCYAKLIKCSLYGCVKTISMPFERCRLMIRIISVASKE